MMIDPKIQTLIDELMRTPSIRRAAFIKGRVFAEGAIPLVEMKRGQLNVSLGAALNRLRKGQKLKPLPFKEFEIDWHAIKPPLFEFRIYAPEKPAITNP